MSTIVFYFYKQLDFESGICSNPLTLEMLKIFVSTIETKGFIQFEIIIDVPVSSFCFI